MTFEYLKPFRTITGDIVTMKALITIYDKQWIEVNESKARYTPEQLVPISPEEYRESVSADSDAECNCTGTKNCYCQN